MLKDGALGRPSSMVQVAELHGTAGGPRAALDSFIHIYTDLLRACPRFFYFLNIFAIAVYIHYYFLLVSSV